MEIKQTYKVNGYIFNLVEHAMLPPTKSGKQRYKAIYIDNRKANDINIEVSIVSENKPHPFSGKTENEFYIPSIRDWGSQGWSFRDMAAAKIKYDGINLHI